MLKILVDFLIDFSNKVFTKENIRTLKRDKYIRNIIKLLIEYTELYEAITQFQEALIKWKNDGFINYIDSDFFFRVNKILNEMQDTYLKLRKLLIVSDYELFLSISYSLHCKINVFMVWQILSNLNEKNYDIYDKKQKTLILPNYSLLLDVNPISDMSKFDKEKRLKELTHSIDRITIEGIFVDILKYENYDNDMFHDCYNLYVASNAIWKESVKYCPIIPKECEVIYLPDDAWKVENIINETQKASDMLRNQIEKVRGLLTEFVGDDKVELIKYL